MRAKVAIEVQLGTQGIGVRIPSALGILCSFGHVQRESLGRLVVLGSVVNHVAHIIRAFAVDFSSLIRRVFGLESHVEVQSFHKLHVQSQHQSVIFLIALVAFFAAIGYGAVMLVFQSHLHQAVHFPFRFIGWHAQRIAVFVFQHGVRGLISIHIGVCSHASVAVGVVYVHGERGFGIEPARQFDVIAQGRAQTFGLIIPGVIAVAGIIKADHIAVDVVSSTQTKVVLVLHTGLRIEIFQLLTIVKVTIFIQTLVKRFVIDKPVAMFVKQFRHGI